MSVVVESASPPTVFHESAFRGRVYGVTGSAHGIGEATVKELARLGAAVVVLDLDGENLRRVRADLESLGAAALCLRGDVADAGFLRRAIRQAHRQWGRLDGWVNNATYNPGGTPDSLPLREMRRCWEVNVEAAWVAIGLLVPIMKAQGGGAIVNLSSIMAHLPQCGNGAYSMAKAGLEGFTRNAAADYAPFRIRINAVVPGSIYTARETPFLKKVPGVPPRVIRRALALRARYRDAVWRLQQPWPLRGEARDVADAILFLLSDAARFITGACLAVDGGAGSFRPEWWRLESNGAARNRASFHALLQRYPALRRAFYRGRGRRGGFRRS